ncbi:MAG: hypothetical protein K2W82_16800 [Candidatus Obscuribacterales bacterium]|nr:hypothetical protein [Candidatus Obscuribacterales bacterium]
MTTSSATDRGAALAILLQGRETQAAERITEAFVQHKLNTEELVVQGFDLDVLCDHLAHSEFDVQVLFNAVFNDYPVNSFNEHEVGSAEEMREFMEELRGYNS